MRHEVKTIEDLDCCCVINAPKVIEVLEKLGLENRIDADDITALWLKVFGGKGYFCQLVDGQENPDTKFIVPQDIFDIFDLLPKTKKVTLELTEEQIESLKQQGIL